MKSELNSIVQLGLLCAVTQGHSGLTFSCPADVLLLNAVLLNY